MSFLLKKRVIYLYIGVLVTNVLAAKFGITIQLDKPSYVTLVIEDSTGKRVQNLIGNRQYPAGTHVVYWDYYDVGTFQYTNLHLQQGTYNLTPRLVKPGKYTVRGLIHEGIKIKYEMSVYSPHGKRSTPWLNPNKKGGWIGEHQYPVVGVKFKPKGSGFPYGPDQDVVIICGHVGEQNDLVAWVDMDGEKLYGTKAENWSGKVGWAANECVENNEVTKDGFTYRINRNNHTVEVFEGNKFVRTIGIPGGPDVGPYDERRMHFPNSITADNMGRIWVAERDQCPRRVSIWKTTGEFVKAIYGPIKYGGGGCLDPKDKTRFYINFDGGMAGSEDMSLAQKSKEASMEFKLDWENNIAIPKSTIWRPLVNNAMRLYGTGPEDATYVNNRLYLSNVRPGFHRHSCNGVGIWMMDEKNNIAIPVACIGQLNEWPVENIHTKWDEMWKPELRAKWPAGEWMDIIYAWSDLNQDGKVQANEATFRNVRSGRNNSRFQLGADLSATNAAGLYIPPPTFDEKGVPIYDLSKAYHLADLEGVATSLSNQTYVDAGFEPMYVPDGWFIFTSFPMVGYFNGKRMWQYNAKSDGPAPGPGEMTNVTKIWGLPVLPSAGDAGYVWVVGGDKGNAYMLTSDGLFITELFGDERQKRHWDYTSWSRGMEIDASLHDEAFFQRIVQTHDGKIYLIVGHEHISICEVVGLEKVRRLTPWTIEVKRTDIDGLDTTKTPPPPPTVAAVLYPRISNVAPNVDGNVSEWDSSAFVPITNEIWAAMTFSGDKMYMAYKTGKPDLLQNSGGQNGNYQTIFKTGGALDLFLDVDSIKTSGLSATWRTRLEPYAGDRRLIVTKVGEQTKAVLYQPVVAGTPENEKIVFQSTIAKTVIDKITDVSSSVVLAGANGNFEYSIPISVLGIKAANLVNNATTMGDVGVLVGMNNNTVERLYWKNKNTSQTADIPTEAKFTPNAWGLLRFRQVDTSNVEVEQKFQITTNGVATYFSAGVLKIGGMPKAAAAVSISDLFGRIKITQKVTDAWISVPAAGFASGLYFVVVSDRWGKVLTRTRVTIN